MMLGPRSKLVTKCFFLKCQLWGYSSRNSKYVLFSILCVLTLWDTTNLKKYSAEAWLKQDWHISYKTYNFSNIAKFAATLNLKFVIPLVKVDFRRMNCIKEYVAKHCNNVKSPSANQIPVQNLVGQGSFLTIDIINMNFIFLFCFDHSLHCKTKKK